MPASGSKCRERAPDPGALSWSGGHVTSGRTGPSAAAPDAATPALNAQGAPLLSHCASMNGALRRIRTTRYVAAEAARNPALRRAVPAFLAFNMVEYGSWVVILIYAYSATGPASVGFVALAQLLPAAVVAPLAATLGDRYPRERILLAAYLVLAACTVTTAAGMLLAWAPLAVYTAAVAASMSLTLVRPAHSSLMPSLARTPEELTAANAVSSIAEAGGLLAGPLLAAAVLTWSTPGVVLALLAGAALIAAILVLGLRPLRRPQLDRHLGALRQPRVSSCQNAAVKRQLGP